MLLHRLDHWGRRFLQLDGLHHTTATDLADLRQPEVANALLKACPRLGCASMQRLVREHAQRRGTGGTDQGITGESAAVAPLGYPVADRLSRDGHADWQAVGDRLRETQDVGHDVLAHKGERRPGPKARLDLVTYKKDAAGVAPFADPPQITLGGPSDPALPLDRLAAHPSHHHVHHPSQR